MPHQIIAFFVCAIAALFVWPDSATAEMGPCVATGKDVYASEDILICGSGEGSARVIAKTTSPSKQFALAWRLTNRPPVYQPIEHDNHLENLIVRIKEGTILAKTHSAYWVTGDRTEKANVIASWSPDSRFLIAGTETVDSENVELFWIAQDDSVTGPLDLVKLLEPAARAQMRGIKNANDYTLRITYLPGISIDNTGLIHASIYMAERESKEGAGYYLTAQVTHSTDSLEAQVLSISEHHGPTISVTIH
jgi:hypothetical protein